MMTRPILSGSIAYGQSAGRVRSTGEIEASKQRVAGEELVAALRSTAR
jgi:hypothetical protein